MGDKKIELAKISIKKLELAKITSDIKKEKVKLKALKKQVSIRTKDVLGGVSVLNKKLNQEAIKLNHRQVRYLVSSYYQKQEDRKRSANQVKKLIEYGEPSDIIQWTLDQALVLENGLKKAMDTYTNHTKISIWARSIFGIGPIIAAGLEAHIDIEKAVTVGHIWRFAGLDPTVEWKPKETRPFNADLKTLCWKIGESFVKVHNKDEDFYGKIYKKKKEIEIERNEKGLFSGQAEAKLKKFDIKDKEAREVYESGKLTKGHIEQRAKRYATKIFLSHWHYVAYSLYHGEAPPKPFAMAILGHAHWIVPPNLELIGLKFKNVA